MDFLENPKYSNKGIVAGRKYTQIQCMCLYQCMWWPLIILFLRDETIVPFSKQVLCKSAFILVLPMFLLLMQFFLLHSLLHLFDGSGTLVSQTLGPKVSQEGKYCCYFPMSTYKKMEIFEKPMSFPKLCIECYYFSM